MLLQCYIDSTAKGYRHAIRAHYAFEHCPVFVLQAATCRLQVFLLFVARCHVFFGSPVLPVLTCCRVKPVYQVWCVCFWASRSVLLPNLLCTTGLGLLDPWCLVRVAGSCCTRSCGHHPAPHCLSRKNEMVMYFCSKVGR